MRSAIASFFVGIIFAIGLGISGMTQPGKVLSFLDVTGAWDGSLAFVMMGAIGVHFILYRLIIRLRKPVLAEKFDIPTRRDIDLRLVTGAAIFGIGWGLGGICPGPAFVSLTSGVMLPVLFIGSMLFGMAAFRKVHSLYTSSVHQPVAGQTVMRKPRPVASTSRPVHP